MRRVRALKRWSNESSSSGGADIPVRLDERTRESIGPPRKSSRGGKECPPHRLNYGVCVRILLISLLSLLPAMLTQAADMPAIVPKPQEMKLADGAFEI